VSFPFDGDGLNFQRGLNCVLPTNVGNLVSFAVPNYAYFAAEGFPYGPFYTGINEYPTLAYLLQVWSRTAGWTNGDNYVNAQALSSAGTISAAGAEFRRIFFDFNPRVTQGTIYGGNPQGSRWGWGQFTYGGYAGPLRNLSFQHCFLEPEWDGADGFNYTLAPHTTGTYNYVSRSLPMQGLTYNVDQAINPSTGIISETDIGAPGPAASGFTQAYGVHMSTFNGTTIASDTTHGELIVMTDTLGFVSDGAVTALLWALCNEIWQTTVYPHAGDTIGTAAAITAPGVVPGGGAFVKQGKFNATHVPTNADYDLGASGAPYLGQWAPVIGPYLGEMQWLNAQQQILRGLPLDCSAIWIAPKPGVTCTLALDTAAQIVLSSDNANGFVNLVQGTTNGLVFT
jgi:hypothetical protein